MSSSSSIPARREYIDTMKGLGIILVVFGHFVEYYRGHSSVFNASFECIYLFHMALFCICSGLVAKWSLRKLLTQQLWLYAVGQILMFLFRMVAYQEDFAATGGVAAALLLPWRHMWYLFALLFWELTVPLLAFLREKAGPIGILAGMAAAAAVGLWAGTMPIPFSYVRVFSFYPFFAFGVLFRYSIDRWQQVCRRFLVLRWSCGIAFLAVYGNLFYRIASATVPVYEGARIFQDASYKAGYTMWDRGLYYLVGILTTLALIGFVGGCKSLRPLGKRTLPVYLLHMPALAFLIELGVYNMDSRPMIAVLAWVIFLSGGAICFFSSTPIFAIFSAVANLWYKILPGLRQSRTKTSL